jgi:hypothetical protein
MLFNPERKRPHGRIWLKELKGAIQKLFYGGVDWIYLAQDGDKWRAFVNVLMNILVL